ncbi:MULTISPECIES: flavin-containing monooxygenase [unclassified Pseudoclavibacter]|uniref:flavin-containing monooxygenase n=1 Tax=unclassified Pseudoclavibacter TaxID=2615177 RepID=UPI000CE826C4|nr:MULTISPECIES: FAD-dependent oxidoreductase [unclassified Pseudoclavibacter]MBS3180455.1 NAD(P)/FAD-dependent oxidoreductase [Pseudoclavibacter sp. Marseille-Q4354]NYF12558.1 thioredoxin reductase [Pseudoclavibacter sp. JAI123]PPG33361.1 pyridine nucleotide-disulfide oxidoreductase [Pseudoclavibacter sp. RFBB5]
MTAQVRPQRLDRKPDVHSVKTDIDLVVIGAGVPGVTVAATLAEMGLRPLRDFVVFDAEPQPGGSWGRGWDFQTVGHTPLLTGPPGLSELGIRLSDQDPEAIVRDIMPPLMRRYEDAYDLFVARPVRVLRVEAMRRSPHLTVHIQVRDRPPRTITTRYVINATGDWSSPFVPWYPGALEFAGEQLPSAHIESLAGFAGKRVMVVGGGRSAVTILRELEPIAAATAWSTRREPDFHELPRLTLPSRTDSRQRDMDARHEAEFVRFVERGERLPSEVSVRGIPLSRGTLAAIRRGLLVSRGPLASIQPDGVTLASGDRFEADAIIWATGSRPTMRHLAPLQLREQGGMARLRDGWSRRDNRVALLGYGTNRRNPVAARLDAERLAEGVFDRLGETPADVK